MADSILNNDDVRYLSINQIMERWQISRNSVVRIARNEGFTAFYPGNKQRSSVRFLRKEVLAYEESRQIVLNR